MTAYFVSQPAPDNQSLLTTTLFRLRPANSQRGRPYRFVRRQAAAQLPPQPIVVDLTSTATIPGGLKPPYVISPWCVDPDVAGSAPARPVAAGPSTDARCPFLSSLD